MRRVQGEGNTTACWIAIAFILSLALFTWGAWAESGLAQSGRGPKLVPLMRDPGPLSRHIADSPTVPATLPGEGWAVDFLHYPSSHEIITFVHQLEESYPDLVSVYVVGESWQGRPIIALRLGNESTGDPDRRPACYVDGQHHAREPLGQQIALYEAWYLLTNYGSDPFATRLLDTRTLYIIPSVNTDGNDIWNTLDHRQRKNANPTASDDDRDGLYDEDPPENLCYGCYELMRLEFDPLWVAQHPENPFVSNWELHLVRQEWLGVYDADHRLVPQVDNDGDGQINEDPIGGVDPNRNYDSHWNMADSNPRSDGYRGPYPWSEPEVRAVRDFVLGHENIITGISYHSGIDMILHPWGWSATQALPDFWLFEQVACKGSQLTENNGFQGSPHGWVARALYQAPAITIDWLYEQNIFAWAPEVYGASRIMFWEPITGTTTSFLAGTSTAAAFSPPPAEIPLNIARWNLFGLYVFALTPNIGISRIEALPATLRLGIANDGYIPVDVSIRVEDKGGSSSYFTISRLKGAERQIELPRATLSDTERYTITLEAHMEIRGTQRTIERETIAFELIEEERESKVLLHTGRLEPWVDLSTYFGEGGWLADPRRWDTPEYHLGPPWATDHIWLPMWLTDLQRNAVNQ